MSSVPRVPAQLIYHHQMAAPRLQTKFRPEIFVPHMWLVTVVTPLSPQILTQRTMKTVAVTKMDGVDVETGTHESVATAVKGQGLVVKVSNIPQELNDQNPSPSAPR